MSVIKTIINHEDERGHIIDLLENKNINAITIVTIKKGAIRGNHYHKKTTQYNYILHGKIKIYTQFGEEAIQTITTEKGALIVCQPMEKHAFVGLEDSEMIVFTEGPRGGKEYESDTFRLNESLVKVI